MATENQNFNNQSFLSIVEMMKAMEVKFSSQISAIQASLQNLALPVLTQAPHSHSNQASSQSQFLPTSQGFATQGQIHAQRMNMTNN